MNGDEGRVLVPRFLLTSGSTKLKFHGTDTDTDTDTDVYCT